jgi:hypothetical protein
MLSPSNKIFFLSDVKLINLNCDYANNGDLTAIEGNIDIPFSIARVFIVRGHENSIRGDHAHKLCAQFLTCPYGRVEVACDDGNSICNFILDKPDVGLFLPPSIWAKQKYAIANSVLSVLCDRPYESDDYIRSYEEYKNFRMLTNLL